MTDHLAKLKKEAAEAAVTQSIKSGMVVGLGTGSTSKFAILKIAELINNGTLKDIVGIPSSLQTKNDALEFGIPLSSFNKRPVIDVYIDGADEVDPKLNVIKGGGGAHLREKIVAQASKKFVVIVDESKLSPFLGTKWHVPIEVISFAEDVEKKYLESIGGTVEIRKISDEELFTSDEGNIILDTNFGKITNPGELALKLSSRAGIVEHGLFIDLVDEVFVAAQNEIKHLVK